MKPRVFPGPVVCIALLIGFSWALALPGFAGENPLKALKKLLEEKLKETVKEKISTQLIKYDKSTHTIAFSPVILQVAGELAKRQLSFLKEFKVSAEGNSLNLDMATTGGSTLKASIIPQAIEVSVKEMIIKGRAPAGFALGAGESVDTSQNLKDSISGLFDTILGVSEKIGTVMKHFKVEGDTFQIIRPLKASSLSRIFDKNEELASMTTQVLPLTVDNGWLSLSLGSIDPAESVTKIVIDLLLMKLKKD